MQNKTVQKITNMLLLLNSESNPYRKVLGVFTINTRVYHTNIRRYILELSYGGNMGSSITNSVNPALQIILPRMTIEKLKEFVVLKSAGVWMEKGSPDYLYNFSLGFDITEEEFKKYPSAKILIDRRNKKFVPKFKYGFEFSKYIGTVILPMLIKKGDTEMVENFNEAIYWIENTKGYCE